MTFSNEEHIEPTEIPNLEKDKSTSELAEGHILKMGEKGTVRKEKETKVQILQVDQAVSNMGPDPISDPIEDMANVNVEGPMSLRKTKHFARANKGSTLDSIGQAQSSEREIQPTLNSGLHYEKELPMQPVEGL